jgi:hypothetical protein
MSYTIVDQFLYPDELQHLWGDFVRQVHWRRQGLEGAYESIHYVLGSQDLAYRAALLVGATLADLRLVRLARFEVGAHSPTRRSDNPAIRCVDVLVRPATSGGVMHVGTAEGFQPVVLTPCQALTFDGSTRLGVSEVVSGQRWSLLLGFGPKT